MKPFPSHPLVILSDMSGDEIVFSYNHKEKKFYQTYKEISFRLTNINYVKSKIVYLLTRWNETYQRRHWKIIKGELLIHHIWKLDLV